MGRSRALCHRVAPTAALVVALVATTGVLAAVSYASSSALTTGVTTPPVRFSAGAGATNSRYVANFALSLNETSFSGTLLGKAGGDVTVKDVARATNTRASSLLVTLTAPSVTNPNVKTFTWTVKNGSAIVGTFDYLASSPSLTFTLPAGATFRLDGRLSLAAGAGKNNATFPFALGSSAS